jgi:hypothetical protein
LREINDGVLGEGYFARVVYRDGWGREDMEGTREGGSEMCYEGSGCEDVAVLEVAVGG